MHKLVRFVVALGFVACAGCGGSDSTPLPDQPELFSGDYFWRFLATDVGPPLVGAASWGQVTGDGAGTISGGAIDFNVGGVPSSAMVTPVPYIVDGQRSMTLSTPGVTWRGAITSDGSLASLAAMGTGNIPAFGVLCRKGSGFDASSLSGNYHLGAFLTNGVEDRGWWGGTVNLLLI